MRTWKNAGYATITHVGMLDWEEHESSLVLCQERLGEQLSSKLSLFELTAVHRCHQCNVHMAKYLTI
jgi:hypothetical protein